MNPDVAAAVDGLERDGTLTAEQARLVGRVARRELVSVETELRLASYVGVLLLTAGVGILVRENFERIGPAGIAAGLAAAAVACFLWVHRHAPPFSRGEAPVAHPAFDYVLLLGALLLGADLAYIEAQFTPLGEAWPYQLLLASVLYLAMAVRYDSRVVLSLALSTFAAWRGVSAARLGHALFSYSADAVRMNAALCGLAFVGLGELFRRTRWKTHFEPVASELGWLVLLVTAFSGVGSGSDRTLFFASLLLVLGGLACAVAFDRRRFSLLAQGVIGAYVGGSVLVVDTADNAFFGFLWFATTPFAMVVLLLVLHRWLRVPR